MITNTDQSLQFNFYVVSSRVGAYNLNTLKEDFGEWAFAGCGHYSTEILFRTRLIGSRIYFYYGSSSTTLNASEAKFYDAYVPLYAYKSQL